MQIQEDDEGDDVRVRECVCRYVKYDYIFRNHTAEGDVVEHSEWCYKYSDNGLAFHRMNEWMNLIANGDVDGPGEKKWWWYSFKYPIYLIEYESKVSQVDNILKFFCQLSFIINIIIDESISDIFYQ